MVVGPVGERRGLNLLRHLPGRGCLPVGHREQVVQEEVGRGDGFHALGRGSPPGLLLEDPEGGVVASGALAGEGGPCWVVGVCQHSKPRLREPDHERDLGGLVAAPGFGDRGDDAAVGRCRIRDPVDWTRR